MLTTTEEVKRVFESEFLPIRERFCILELHAGEAQHSNEKYVWHPGVYVWFHPEKGVLKVGRHFTNSRKRALEHVSDNTGGIIASYFSKPDTRLILFNVKDPDAYHWVAAVEVFLERKTSPFVPSKRQG